MGNRSEEFLELHGRVLSGHPAASLQVFELLQRPLVRVLQRQFGRALDPDQIVDTVTDAILEYLKAPERYDPDRASLFSYVAIIAKGDALNLLRSTKRNRDGYRQFVELQSLDGNVQEDRTETVLDAEAIVEKYGHELIEDDRDVAVLGLMLNGERDTEVYAAVMRVTHLSEDDQKAAVKQRRDRIEKRLARLKARL